MRTAGRSVGHGTLWYAMYRSKGIDMNERIGKLAEETGLLGPGSRVGDAHNAVERFAESLIQECIDIISPYTVRMNRPGEEFLHPISEIKKRFGVE